MPDSLYGYTGEEMIAGVLDYNMCFCRSLRHIVKASPRLIAFRLAHPYRSFSSECVLIAAALLFLYVEVSPNERVRMAFVL